eukprot:scaffold1156_cov394-Prasinococcus_capsulatus_cf.AAC.9
MIEPLVSVTMTEMVDDFPKICNHTGYCLSQDLVMQCDPASTATLYASNAVGWFMDWMGPHYDFPACLCRDATQ